MIDLGCGDRPGPGLRLNLSSDVCCSVKRLRARQEGGELRPLSVMVPR